MDLYNARRRPAGREQGNEQELDEEDFGDDEEAAEQYRLEREEREKARADARARAQVPQGGLCSDDACICAVWRLARCVAWMRCRSCCIGRCGSINRYWRQLSADSSASACAVCILYYV